MFDVNMEAFYPYLLLLLQNDIPLHFLLLTTENLELESKGLQNNLFNTNNAQQFDLLSHFLRGRLWLMNSLNASFFQFTTDCSSSIVSYSNPAIQFHYETASPSIPYPTTHCIINSRITADFDSFMELCIHDGFELDNVSFLNHRFMTVSLVLPLSPTQFLKMILSTVSLFPPSHR